MNNQEQLSEFLAELRDAYHEDTVLFHDLVKRSTTVLNLTDKDFARALNTTRPSVNRWRSGMSAPQPVMRKYIYDFLIKHTQALIKKSCESGKEPAPELDSVGTTFQELRRMLRLALEPLRGYNTYGWPDRDRLIQQIKHLLEETKQMTDRPMPTNWIIKTVTPQEVMDLQANTIETRLRDEVRYIRELFFKEVMRSDPQLYGVTLNLTDLGYESRLPASIERFMSEMRDNGFECTLSPQINPGVLIVSWRNHAK